MSGKCNFEKRMFMKKKNVYFRSITIYIYMIKKERKRKYIYEIYTYMLPSFFSQKALSESMFLINVS